MCHWWIVSARCAPSDLSSPCPARLWALGASVLEANPASFLAPETCLSEQDVTVAVTFPGGLPLRSQLYKASESDFQTKQSDRYILEPQSVPWELAAEGHSGC